MQFLIELHRDNTEAVFLTLRDPGYIQSFVRVCRSRSVNLHDIIYEELVDDKYDASLRSPVRK